MPDEAITREEGRGQSRKDYIPLMVIVILPAVAAWAKLNAYVFPFLELGLGYLARFELTFIYIATIVIMVFGSLGVVFQ